MKCERLGDAGFVCTGDLIAPWVCLCVRNAHFVGYAPDQGHDSNVTHPVAGCPCPRCMRDDTARAILVRPA